MTGKKHVLSGILGLVLLLATLVSSITCPPGQELDCFENPETGEWNCVCIPTGGTTPPTTTPVGPTTTTSLGLTTTTSSTSTTTTIKTVTPSQYTDHNYWEWVKDCESGDCCEDGISCFEEETTTTTSHPTSECTLNSVVISPNCDFGPSPDCEAGESILVEASYSGLCPPLAYIQVDASSDDDACAIEHLGGSMPGIDVICDDSPCSKYWVIPPVPSQCKGKEIRAREAALWKGGIVSGTWITNQEPSGSFKFSLGEFITGKFRCFSYEVGLYLCALECDNRVGESVNVLFLFRKAEPSGEVIKHAIPVIGHGESREVIIASPFNCAGRSGIFKVSWKAYLASDTNLENPLAWSKTTEEQEIDCFAGGGSKIVPLPTTLPTTLLPTTIPTTFPPTTILTTTTECPPISKSQWCPYGTLCPQDVDENGCPRWRCDLCPTVTTTTLQECEEGEVKYYLCPDGSKVFWCSCENGEWNCIISPEKGCVTKCIKEGEWGDRAVDLNLKCCEGLDEKPHYDSDTCTVLPDLKFTCVKCGNDICGLGEDECNCPQDCPTTTSTTTTTMGYSCKQSGGECKSNTACRYYCDGWGANYRCLSGNFNDCSVCCCVCEGGSYPTTTSSGPTTTLHPCEEVGGHCIGKLKCYELIAKKEAIACLDGYGCATNQCCCT
jgi:hypothetical protein